MPMTRYKPEQIVTPLEEPESEERSRANQLQARQDIARVPMSATARRCPLGLAAKREAPGGLIPHRGPFAPISAPGGRIVCRAGFTW
jgi:hypothetical protein